MSVERRDIVWALLELGGLIYDLERRVIVGLLPRGDMLPILALGLGARWEQRDNGLWLRAPYLPAPVSRDAQRLLPDQWKLTLTQRQQARTLIANGKSLRQVARHFGVSRMAIWRIVHS